MLDAIRFISFVHLSSTSTLEVLKLLKPRLYIKGNDWIARGGVPNEEQDACNSLDIEVKYLDTVLNSSTQLLADWSTQ